MSSPNTPSDPGGPIPIVPDAALDAPPGVRSPTPGALTCIGCGYNLQGLPPTGTCPECGKAVALSLGSGLLVDTSNPNATLAMDKACVTCGYNLRGARLAGACPECGSPVAISLRGDLLQFASPAWVLTLRKGLSNVLNGILLMIVVMILSGIIGVAGAALGLTGIQLLTTGLSLAVSLMIAWGYWQMTEPDPGVDTTEKVQQYRKTIRVVVAIQAGLALLQFVAQGVVLANATLITVFGIIIGILTVLGLVAWVIQFICVMNYIAWMGTRVPDAWMVRRAKRYRWLLPVIAVPGIILLFLGPLIALVMYWNILDRLRKHCKAIEKTGSPAQLKGVAALG